MSALDTSLISSSSGYTWISLMNLTFKKPTNRKPPPMAAVAAQMMMLSMAPVIRKVDEMKRQKRPLPLVDLTRRKFSLMSFKSKSERNRMPPNILQKGLASKIKGME